MHGHLVADVPADDLVLGGHAHLQKRVIQNPLTINSTNAFP